jgi:hypothetical protein
MTALVKLAAAGSAGLAAASAAAWVVVSSEQPTRKERQEVVQQLADGPGECVWHSQGLACDWGDTVGQPGRGSGADEDLWTEDEETALIVCVASDAVVRASDDGVCPPGQTAVALSAADMSVVRDPPGSGRQGVTPSGPRSNPLFAFERRLREVEQSPLLEVVNDRGNPILSVEPQGVRVFNSSLLNVADVLASEEGGVFKGRSADHRVEASIGALGGKGGVWITENGITRLELARRSEGNYSLVVPSGIDGAIAGIGVSRAGTGAVVIGDRAGRMKASMLVTDEKGAVGIRNGRGAGVLSLSQNAAGGGLFVIGDATSEPMVKMTVNDDRYGVVLAGPIAGFPLVPSTGLPGSYFLGCAPGPACRP